MANRVRQAVQLDHRIGILRAVNTTSEFNEPVPTWSTVLELWAMREDITAAESYRAVAVDAQITTRFTIRYSPESATIDAKHRIACDGRTYNITKVREVKRNEWLELDAVARADV